MSDGREAAVPDPLQLLLQLQDLDLHADRLAHQIEHHPIRVEQRGAEARRASLAKRRAEIEADATPHRKRQAELEGEIAAIDARVVTIDQRMRSSASGSFRDQAAMSTEVGSLAKRKGELEDEELAAMEALEPVDLELEALAADDQVLNDEIAERGDALSIAVGELEVTLKELRAKRPALVAEVPAGLLEEYERLRARLGGIGAAHVVRGACSGCNLSLSSTELDHLRHAPSGSISHCEQCGRILVAA